MMTDARRNSVRKHGSTTALEYGLAHERIAEHIPLPARNTGQ